MAGLGYLLYERGLGRAWRASAQLDRGPALHQPERRYRQGLFQRRHVRGAAQPPGARSGLQVASRTSAFAYKGRNVDIRQVGEELGVETVLEGSVRQAGDQVRITAQLIDTETGFHLWSETYDRQLADIFQVQDEIAQCDRRRLNIQLAPEEQQLAQRTRAPTQNVEAYELYLQGRAIWKKSRWRKPEACDRALPVGPRARSGVRPCARRARVGLRGAARLHQGAGRREEVQPHGRDVRAPGARARTQDRRSARGAGADQRRSRGLARRRIRFFFAISLEPNEPTPHHWYSILFNRVGRLHAALTQARRAYELDPSSPIIAANLGNAYLLRGRRRAGRCVTRSSQRSSGSPRRSTASRPPSRCARVAGSRRRREIAHQDMPEKLKPLAADAASTRWPIRSCARRSSRPCAGSTRKSSTRTTC